MSRASAVDAIAIEYSYAEILDFAGELRRDMARRREIESMFSVLSGAGHLEEYLYWCYQRRLAAHNEDRASDPFRFAQYARASYARLKADNGRYTSRLAYKAEHKRKRRRKSAPGYARGERSGGAKLTEGKVREVLSSPLSGAELARKLGVSPATISGIRSRKKWAHVQPQGGA